MNNFLLIITNPQKLISKIIKGKLVKEGFYIWILSTLLSCIIEFFTGLNEKNFLHIYNIFNTSIYIKILLFFMDSMFKILLIAFFLNISALLFKRESEYLTIFISLLHVELYNIYIFPVQLILLITKNISWINYSIYFVAFLEIIFILKAVKSIYKIDKLYKTIFIFVLGILFLCTTYILIFFALNDISLKQNEMDSIDSNYTNLICEIETMDYNQISDNYYNINCLVTVKILNNPNKDLKSYYCSIVKDYVIVTIHNYISMHYNKIDKIELKEYVITNCNSFLSDENIKIHELICNVTKHVKDNVTQ